ncbi:hypothetical protein FQN50_003161 [Emmonsiellopsis sp. PD_5]|nr:hypothetical protein FQN50_003161 [Emmonsiellopsis sp. PD_5]
MGWQSTLTAVKDARTALKFLKDELKKGPEGGGHQIRLHSPCDHSFEERKTSQKTTSSKD